MKFDTNIGNRGMIRYDLYPTGRKNCPGCGCWRHVYEFNLRRSGRLRGQLKARCRTCDRLEARVRLARARGRTEPYGPAELAYTHCHRGHPLSGDNVRIYERGGYQCRVCRACVRENRRNVSGPKLERRREYVRFYEDAQRRARGAKQIRRRERAPFRPGEDRKLDPGPFAEWLRERVARDGHSSFALQIGMNERRLRAVLNGEDGAVSLNVVDAALTEYGVTNLWELYPDLYPDDEPRSSETSSEEPALA